MANLYKSTGPVSTFLTSLSLPDLNSATHPRHHHFYNAPRYRSCLCTLLHFSGSCSSSGTSRIELLCLRDRNPINCRGKHCCTSSTCGRYSPCSPIARSVRVSTLSSHLTACIDISFRTYSHGPEFVHSAEKSRRRSFRRYVVSLQLH
jgi:hypothetical protein